MVKIAPSILSANFANLGNEIKNIEQAGADYIHIDVMDGHFVPNLTFGPAIIKAIRSHTNLPFDVHLMIEKPELHISEYIKSGADIITIHPEATTHLDRVISQIKEGGKKAGISLLPTSSPEIIKYLIDKIDLILIMTVNPGFAGQEFLYSQLDKIKEVAKIVNESGYSVDISVDGGINNETSGQCIKNGATVLVAGSYVFAGDYQERIKLLRDC